MLRIGIISYSLYMWQELFFNSSRTVWLNTPLAEAVKLAIVAGVAYLSYVLVERPIIDRGRRNSSYPLRQEEGKSGASLGHTALKRAESAL